MLSTLYILNRFTTYTRPVLIDLVAWDLASKPCCKVLKSMYPSRGRHDNVGTSVGLLRCRDNVWLRGVGVLGGDSSLSPCAVPKQLGVCMEKSFCRELVLISMLTEVCDMASDSSKVGLRLEHLVSYIRIDL